MKWLLLFAPFLLPAQSDPASGAYRAWEKLHSESDFRTHAQALFEASADWVAKWPDSKLAWDRRRESLMSTRNVSPDLWKQVDENLIRLSPPHTFTSLAAYDWVMHKINVPEGEALITDEIEWIDSRPRPELPAQPSLSALIEDAYFGSKVFGPLTTLASAQIQRKEFDAAHQTIRRIRAWLDGDFRKHFDQAPYSVFPDYEAKELVLSAQLAQAEGKNLDALSYFQRIIANPYFRSQYGGWVQEAHELWLQLGGSEDAWPAFSNAAPVPAGDPRGHRGMPFQPWVSLAYKLPEFQLSGLDSHVWKNSDLDGKTTLVFLFASWCAPCWRHLPAVQAIYEKMKDRRDIQVVALSVDEEPETLASFMRSKGYSFPVMIGKEYADRILPEKMLGQVWIVDKTGSIRLWRSPFLGGEKSEADEGLYRLTQISER